MSKKQLIKYSLVIALVGAILLIVSIFLKIFIDKTSQYFITPGFALLIIGFVAAIMFDLIAISPKKLAEKDNFLAEWHYDQHEWKIFVDYCRKNEKKSAHRLAQNFALIILIIIFVISWMVRGYEIGVEILLVFVLALIPLARSWRIFSFANIKDPVALISRIGMWRYNEMVMWHKLENIADIRIIGVESLNIMQIDYRDAQTGIRTVELLIPRGKIDEANNIINVLITN